MKKRLAFGDAAEVVAAQNPWHRSAGVPRELARPAQRPLARALSIAVTRSRPLRYQVVLGPRRVGKTTVMYQTVERLLESGVPADRLWWVRLDHPVLMQSSLGELVQGLLGAHAAAEQPFYIFLDELAYAERWDLWLKTFFDERWPVRVIATSSSTAVLKNRRHESGVGRWEEQHLPPWSFTEYLELRDSRPEVVCGESLWSTLEWCLQRPAIARRLEEHRRRFLLVGGFPELLTLPPDEEESEILRSQRILRTDAIERSIYKDLPQAFGIGEPMKLERLLYVLAGQMTGILSPHTVASELGISQPTVERYLSYIQQAFLVFLLPNYSGSEETVQRRGRKLYFADGATRNAALQRGTAPLRDPIETGLLFENAVASHLHALARQTNVRLYHWRQRQHEVDLVYDHPAHPVAFEIASSPRHGRKSLLELQRRHGRFRSRCFLVSPEAAPTHPGDQEDGVGRIPLDMLLLALGAQTQYALEKRIGIGT